MRVPNYMDMLSWIKPEPAPPEELEWAEKMRPGEYEVYWEKLNNIVFEANTIFVRTGLTEMLRAGDCAVGLYTRDGDLIASYCGTYLHSAAAGVAVKFVMENWKDDPTVGVYEGDYFYMSDTRYGGVHNPDQIGFMPIFCKGEHIAWSAAIVHQGESGAVEPGGMPLSSKSRYDEGMKLSPIKVGRNYTIHNDMLEMMANEIGRSPRIQINDVKARMAGCDRVRLRLQEMAEEKSVEFVRGLLRKVLIVSEEASRNRIKNWNDGKYRVAIFTDGTGWKPGIIRLFLTLIKEGDKLTMDFTGSSPEQEASWQGFAQVTVAHTCTYTYAYPFYDLSPGTGTYAPIDFILPYPSFINPAVDAAVANGPPMFNVVWNSCYATFSKMMFDSPQRPIITGCAGGFGCCSVIAGVNQWGVPIAELTLWPLCSAGQGARTDMDGMNAYGFAWCHPGKSPEKEDFENEYPGLVLLQKHRKDSCGHGKYKGGSGTQHVMTIWQAPYAFMAPIACCGSKLSPMQGLFGGYPAPPVPLIRVYGSDAIEKLQRGDKDFPSDVHELVQKRAIKGKYEFSSTLFATYQAFPGDLHIQPYGGGTGYGDVLERDPEAVMQDLRDVLITHRTAEQVYHVVYDHDTLMVDYEKTEQQKQEERESRKARGIPYEEFEKEWLMQKLDDELLHAYGSWPDAKPERTIVRM